MDKLIYVTVNFNKIDNISLAKNNDKTVEIVNVSLIDKLLK